MSFKSSKTISFRNVTGPRNHKKQPKKFWGNPWILSWSRVASRVGGKIVLNFNGIHPTLLVSLVFVLLFLWRFNIPNLLRLWAKLYRNPSFCWSLKYLVVDRRFIWATKIVVLLEFGIFKAFFFLLSFMLSHLFCLFFVFIHFGVWVVLCSVYDGLLCRHYYQEPDHLINKHFKHGRGAFPKGCLKRGPSAGAGKYSCSLDRKKDDQHESLMDASDA